MSCDTTVEGRQTEFDFYQQLMNTPNGSDCCGPKTAIGFTRPTMQILVNFVLSAGRPPEYLDTYDPQVLGSTQLSLTMCARHWFQHSDLLHKASHLANRSDWNELSFYLFEVTCFLNDWDVKEISNYLR